MTEFEKLQEIAKKEFGVTLIQGEGIASVNGASTYKYGASVTVRAEILDGYSWTGWTGTLTSSNQEYTFNMPANTESIDHYELVNSSDSEYVEINTESLFFSL